MNFENFASFFPNVSRETFDQLVQYSALLSKWNRTINLVSSDTLSDLWHRHIVDSLQLAQYIPLQVPSIVDVGSGAGLPGAVLAIAGYEGSQDQEFTLIDSDHRKAEFLRTVARELGVPFQVLTARVGDIAPLEASVLTARAFAPLTDLLGLAKRHLAQDGIALFLKGANVASEISDARRAWRFEMDAFPSMTSPQARILKIRGIQHV